MLIAAASNTISSTQLVCSSFGLGDANNPAFNVLGRVLLAPLQDEIAAVLHPSYFGAFANCCRWREASVDPSLIALWYHARA